MWIAFEARAAEPAARQPNVVIIFADDLGYSDLGSFGAKGYRTPNLDRMASQGRRFTNFHVSQPVCSASRAALLTGCYSNRIGIHGALGPSSRVGIADGEVTLAQLLKQKGYATGMAGKWHLGHHAQFLPTKHGFDEYLGLPYSNDMWPHHPEAKRGTYPPLPLLEDDHVLNPDIQPKDMDRLTTQYTERAVSFIKRHRGEPFFFYLAHSMPHVPLAVSEKYRGTTERGLYGDVIEEIDWSVGEVLRTLKEEGLEDNTLVVFTSDNGPWLSYGDHAGRAEGLREGKGTTWEGGVRVPCVMRWPGKLPAGTTCDRMIMTIDLFPTLAKLVGATLPDHGVDGRDVWPILAGSADADNPHDGYVFYYEQNQLQAVVTGDGRWKLQFAHAYRTLGGRPGGTGGIPAKYEVRNIARPELFDLANDRAETTDLAAKHPRIVESLTRIADRYRNDLGDALTSHKGNGIRAPGRYTP